MTGAETHPSWQPLAAQDFAREHHPHLSMSSAGKCARSQAYALMGIEESDPPARHAQNRMNLGHAAEVLIVMDLHQNGWETGHTVLSNSGQLELEVQVPGPKRSSGDTRTASAATPEFTQNLWVTLECKSMSERKGLEVEEQGVGQIYPAYMTQIGLYGRRLYEMGLVSHPERGVFAMMDRDGRPLTPERVSWTAEDVDRDYELIREIIETAQADELPDRPYYHGSKICGYCSYHTECWGTYKAWQEKGRPVLTNDTRGIDAAETWMKAKPQVDEAPAGPPGALRPGRRGRHHRRDGPGRLLRAPGQQGLQPRPPGGQGPHRNPEAVLPGPEEAPAQLLGQGQEELTGTNPPEGAGQQQREQHSEGRTGPPLAHPGRSAG